VRAGELDRPIVLERRFAATNSFGEQVEGWAPVGGTVFAGFTPASGGESFGNDQRVAEQRVTFEIRYRPGISPATHRIVFDGRVYEIEDVAEPERRKRLLITARVQDAASGPEEE
jgi:SPP1 family predicted phage head-tail adaptor